MLDVIPVSTDDPNPRNVVISEYGLLGVEAISLDYNHLLIHGGKVFCASSVYRQIPDQQYVDFGIAPTSGMIHFETSIGTEGKATLLLYENSTYQSGLVFSGYNANRSFTSPSTTIIYSGIQNIELSGSHLLLESINFGGDKSHSVGVSNSSILEWVLDPSKNYVLRVRNEAGAPKDIGVLFHWSEGSRHYYNGLK